MTLDHFASYLCVYPVSFYQLSGIVNYQRVFLYCRLTKSDSLNVANRPSPFLDLFFSENVSHIFAAVNPSKSV